jgi:hypothetical protein
VGVLTHIALQHGCHSCKQTFAFYYNLVYNCILLKNRKLHEEFAQTWRTSSFLLNLLLTCQHLWLSHMNDTVARAEGITGPPVHQEEPKLQDVLCLYLEYMYIIQRPHVAIIWFDSNGAQLANSYL